MIHAELNMVNSAKRGGQRITVHNNPYMDCTRAQLKKFRKEYETAINRINQAKGLCDTDVELLLEEDKHTAFESRVSSIKEKYRNKKGASTYDLEKKAKAEKAREGRRLAGIEKVRKSREAQRKTAEPEEHNSFEAMERHALTQRKNEERKNRKESVKKPNRNSGTTSAGNLNSDPSTDTTKVTDEKEYLEQKEEKERDNVASLSKSSSSRFSDSKHFESWVISKAQNIPKADKRSKNDARRREYRDGHLVHANGYTTPETRARIDAYLAKKSEKRQARIEARAAARRAARLASKTENHTQSGVWEMFTEEESCNDDYFWPDYMSPDEHHIWDLAVMAFDISALAESGVEKLLKLGSDLTEISREYLHIAIDYICDYEKYIRTTLVLLYQLYKSNSMALRLCALHNYISCFDVGITATIKGYFSDIVELVSIHVAAYRTESGFLSKSADLYDIVLNSKIVDCLRKLVLTVTSQHLFSKDVSQYIYKVLGNPIKMTVTEFIPFLLRSVDAIMSFGRAILNGVPIIEALTTDDPMTAASRRVNELVQRQSLVYTGLPVEGCISIESYIETLRDNIVFLEKSVNDIAPFRRAPFIDSITKGRNILRDKISLLEAGTRPTPFAVVLTSAPGTGKSVLLPWLFETWSSVKGRDFNMGQIFSRCIDSDYWEGYDPISQPYIHYSEVGKDHINIVSKMGDSSINEIISVIDSLPYQANMAFENKGKVFVRPDMVAIDTNVPDLNVKYVVNNPAAYLRRFLFIDVTVKPEFRKDNSSAIDPNKSFSGAGHLLDRYTFDVYKETPVNNIRSTRNYLANGIDIYQLYTLLQDLFTDHIKTADLVESKLRGSREPLFVEKEVEITDGDGVVTIEKRLYKTHEMPDNDEYDDKSDNESECGPFHLINDMVDYYGYIRTIDFVYFIFTWLFWYKTQTIWKSDYYNAMKFLAIGWLSRYIKTLCLWAAAYYLGRRSYFILYPELEPQPIREYTRSGYRYRMAQLRNVFRGESISQYLLYSDSPLALFARGFAVGSIIGLIYKWWTYKNDLVEAGISDDIEDGFDIQPKIPRESTGATKFWNRVEETPRQLHKGPLSTTNFAQHNVRAVIIERKELQKTHIFGVKGNFALINEHVFEGDDYIDIRISRHIIMPDPATRSAWLETRLYRDQCYCITKDVLMFEVMGIMFRDMLGHFIPKAIEYSGSCKFDNNVSSFTLYDKEMPLKMRNGGVTSIGPFLKYENPNHKSGECGKPILIEYKDGCCIGAIHAGGASNRTIAFGAVISQEMISAGIDSLCSMTGALEAVSQGPLDMLKLEKPHPKSIVHYESVQGGYYYGKLKGNIILENTSNLRLAKNKQDIEEIFSREFPDHKFVEFAKPRMRPGTINGEYISPYNLAFRKMFKQRCVLDKLILNNIVNELTERFLTQLKDRGVDHLSPLSVHEAINGVDGDPFIKSMNFSTSAAFGRPGKKSQYLPLMENGKRTMCEELSSSILNCKQRYLRGEACHFVYSVKLKDEPRSVDKVKMGKTRLFFMSPLDCLILNRMFLAPLYSLMVQHGDIFCTAIGIDMHREAHTLYDRLTSFSSNFIEGDYSNFDQGMPIGVGDAVNRIIFNILKELGYSDTSLKVLRGVLTDNLFPYIEVLQDIFCVPGLQCSGKYGTAEDNSLRNLVLLMYCWKLSDQLKNMDFFEYVIPVTYGDDVLGSTREEKFDNLYIQKCIRSIGMDFTSSDKGADLESFIPLERITLLKRTFQHHKELQRIVAPLDLSSMRRMLTWIMPTWHVSAAEQTMSTYRSFMQELCLYGDSGLYDRFREFLSKRLEDLYGLSTFEIIRAVPPWSVVIKSLTLDEDQDPIDTLAVNGDPFWEFFSELAEAARTEGGPMSVLPRYTSRHSVLNTLEQYEKERDEVLREIRVRKLDAYINVRGPRMRYVLASRGVSKEDIDLIVRHHDLKVTIDRLEWMVLEAKTQSGDLASGDTSATSIAVNTTLTDILSRSETEVIAGDSTRINVGQSTKYDLNTFLARPIEIYSGAWSLNTHFTEFLEVWDLFTIEPSVRAKLRNYAFLRGNLHVRVVFSATPYHYSKMLISYQPYGAQNDTLSGYVSVLSLAGVKPLLNNYLSQAPDASVADVSSNEPTEIICPFISPKGAHRLYNSTGTAISAISSYADLAQAGQLVLSSINPLKSSSNDNVSPIGVKVYAWMEDVELGTTTGTWLEVITESGPLDERETGPLERFSSSAEEISGALTTVPYLSPFARASQMAFGALRMVASHMGWSRPVIVSDNATFMKNMPFQNGANTTGSETSYRLTLDPKQELSIVPQICGVDEDDMHINALSSRISYVDSREWAQTDVGLLAVVLVSPMIETRLTYSGSTYVQPTAVAFATRPFSSWHGTMKYRIEVVKSKFMRGKLLITYEPNSSAVTTVGADDNMNKQSSIIMDIQDATCLDISVNWASSRAWCAVPNSSANEYQFDIYVNDAAPERHNGYLTISVFTPITGPNNEPAYVNLYAWCDDLQVNCMTGVNCPTKREFPVAESGPLYCSETTPVDINKPAGDFSAICHEHYGERPVSFRSLLKRYVVSDYVTTTTGAAGTRLQFIGSHMPKNVLPYGSSTLDGPYMNLFSYLRYAYLGYRGSVRKRLRLSNFNALNCETAQVSLQNQATSPTYGASNVTTYGSTMDGTVTYSLSHNNGIEFEIPFYSNNLWQISFNTLGYGGTQEWITYWTKAYIANFPVPATTSVQVWEESASGEDFCFMRFQGSPLYKV